MAIDASVYRLQQPQDWGEKFSNALLTGTRIGSQLAQNQREEELQPLRNRLLEAQTGTTEQQLTEEQADFQLRDAATDAYQIKSLIDAGQTDRAQILLGKRIQKITDRGGNPKDSIELMQAFESGNMDLVNAELDTVLGAAQQFGLFNSGVPASIRDRQDLIDRLPVDENGNLLPPDQMNAAQRAAAVEAGLVPRESLSAEERIAADPEKVGQVANLAGEKAGAAEGAKLGQQLEVRPDIEERIAESKVRGKSQGESAAALPETLANAEYSLTIIDKALNHPGLDVATGFSSRVDPRNFVPGTNAYDFKVLMDQIQGRVFLQAYESLKGGGQITEVEGKKAEQSISRLNKAQSKEEFVNALTELRGIIETGIERSRKKAGGFKTSSGISFEVE